MNEFRIEIITAASTKDQLLDSSHAHSVDYPVMLGTYTVVNNEIVRYNFGRTLAWLGYDYFYIAKLAILIRRVSHCKAFYLLGTLSLLLFCHVRIDKTAPSDRAAGWTKATSFSSSLLLFRTEGKNTRNAYLTALAHFLRQPLQPH